MILQLRLLYTLYYNLKVKGIRNISAKQIIFLFKNGYFNIHKTAKINIHKGQFFFNNQINILEPFPSLLEMQKNSVLDIKNGFRVCPGCHIVIAQGATLKLGSGYMNRNSKIRCVNNIEIGEDVAISENCTIWDNDAHTIQYNTIQYLNRSFLGRKGLILNP